MRIIPKGIHTGKFLFLLAAFVLALSSLQGQIITAIAGNYAFGRGYSGDGGTATAAELYEPWGVAFDASGNLYIADWVNNVIRLMNTSGTISTIAGNNAFGRGYGGDGETATAAELYAPFVVGFDTTGSLYIADAGNSVIRKVTLALTVVANPTTNVTCNAGTNGSASVTPSTGIPPYTYSWSPSGGSDSTASGLSAGIYTVNVTDSIGLTGSATVTISQPDSMYLVPGVEFGPACEIGIETYDTAIIVVTGGTPPYNYNYALGGQGAAQDSLVYANPGIYSVIITDSNGCSASSTFTLPGGYVDSVSDSVWCDTTAGFGGAEIFVTGGDYTISWGNCGDSGTSTCIGNYIDGVPGGTITTYNIIGSCPPNPIYGGQITIPNCSVTGITEVNTPATGIKIYPIPAQSSITVSISGNQLIPLKEQIFDVTGRLVWEDNSPPVSASFSINVGWLNNGVYLFKIIGKDEYKIAKFIVVN